MTARRIFSLLLLALLGLLAWGGWWTTEWTAKRPIAASGGLYFPGRTELYGPQFSQADPRWTGDALASTPGTLSTFQPISWTTS